MKYEIIRSKRKTLALEVRIDGLIVHAPNSTNPNPQPIGEGFGFVLL